VDDRTTVDFDVQNDGATALAVLGRVNGNADVARTTQYLAASFAAALPVGESAVIVTENITVTVVSQAGAGLGGTNVSGNGTTLSFPADVALPGVQATSAVATAVSSFVNNPVASSSLLGRSSVADLTVVVDGVVQHLSNLAATPLQVTIVETALNSSSAVQIWYYDVTTQAWSQSGLNQTSSQNDVATCTTTHLTLFGAFSAGGNGSHVATPAPTPAPSSSAQLAVAFAAVLLSALVLCA